MASRPLAVGGRGSTRTLAPAPVQGCSPHQGHRAEAEWARDPLPVEAEPGRAVRDGAALPVLPQTRAAPGWLHAGPGEWQLSAPV